MIQANELRIGNIVKDEDGNYRFISHVHKNYIGLSSVRYPQLYSMPHDLDEIEPVQISEEILLKCRAVRGSVTMYFIPIPSIKCEIHATWFHNQYVIELQNDRIPIVTEVKYLHQLQNLYFALTGKELEVKL